MNIIANTDITGHSEAVCGQIESICPVISSENEKERLHPGSSLGRPLPVKWRNVDEGDRARGSKMSKSVDNQVTIASEAPYSVHINRLTCDLPAEGCDNAQVAVVVEELPSVDTKISFVDNVYASKHEFVVPVQETAGKLIDR